MREILVHYHLFKNAGSSIDKILRDAFGEQWISHDPPKLIPAVEMAEFIEQNPDARAISSHMLCSPIAKCTNEEIKVLPIVVLREPISRIRSAWLFEWMKQIGKEEPIGSITEYIQEKFSVPRGNAIENFQCVRLSNVKTDSTRCPRSVKDRTLLENAQQFIDDLPVFGLVEKFEESLEMMSAEYGHISSDLKFVNTKKNVIQDTSKTIEERQTQLREEIGEELYAEVILRNQLDIELYAYACGKFNTLYKNHCDFSIAKEAA